MSPTSFGDTSNDNIFLKSFVKLDYLLRSRVKVGLVGDSGEGLDFNKAPGGLVGKISFLSKALMKAKKEVQDGRQSMIYRALRAGLAHPEVTQ